MGANRPHAQLGGFGALGLLDLGLQTHGSFIHRSSGFGLSF